MATSLSLYEPRQLLYLRAHALTFPVLAIKDHLPSTRAAHPCSTKAIKTKATRQGCVDSRIADNKKGAFQLPH